jgi:hypothetical protein
MVAGIDASSQALGHSDINTTLSIYGIGTQPTSNARWRRGTVARLVRNRVLKCQWAEMSRACAAALGVAAHSISKASVYAGKWRRRESNPRPQPHRMSIYKLRLPFDFARRPECSRPTVALAILQCRALGDWLSLGAEPVSWRRSGPRAQLGGASPTSSYELGSECEITRIRICFLPVDLRGQPATSACSSSGWIDHVETRSPPYVCSSTL